MYKEIIDNFDYLPDEQKDTILRSINPDLVKALYAMAPEIPYIKELMYQVNHDTFVLPTVESYKQWVERYKQQREAIVK